MAKEHSLVRFASIHMISILAFDTSSPSPGHEHNDPHHRFETTRRLRDSTRGVGVEHTPNYLNSLREGLFFPLPSETFLLALTGHVRHHIVILLWNSWKATMDFAARQRLNNSGARSNPCRSPCSTPHQLEHVPSSTRTSTLMPS